MDCGSSPVAHGGSSCRRAFSRIPRRILCLRPAHGEDDSVTGTVANRVRSLTLDCVASDACSITLGEISFVQVWSIGAREFEWAIPYCRLDFRYGIKWPLGSRV